MKGGWVGKRRVGGRRVKMANQVEWVLKCKTVKVGKKKWWVMNGWVMSEWVIGV